jgi:hypothetical protein
MIAQLDKSFIRLAFGQAVKRIIVYLFYEGRPLTTKGRWFNGIVFLWLRLQAMLCSRSPDVDPVYIIGTGRSGTTILGVCLGVHKDVVFLNEPKALWSYAYPNEDIIGSYQGKRGKYRLNSDDITDESSNTLHSIYACLRWLLRGKCIVDKYPELVFRYSFVKGMFPGSKFIFLFRNGWDTCHSIDLWSRRKGHVANDHTQDWWGLDDRKWLALCDEVVVNDPELCVNYEKIRSYTDHRYRAAVEWILCMKEGLDISRDNESVMTLKYEDFVSSPAVRISVLDFCGLPADDVYSEYCSEVLVSPPSKPAFPLPDEINGEFHRVMAELNYE